MGACDSICRKGLRRLPFCSKHHMAVATCCKTRHPTHQTASLEATRIQSATNISSIEWATHRPPDFARKRYTAEKYKTTKEKTLLNAKRHAARIQRGPLRRHSLLLLLSLGPSRNVDLFRVRLDDLFFSRWYHVSAIANTPEPRSRFARHRQSSGPSLRSIG